jgi:hypothetical protein
MSPLPKRLKWAALCLASLFSFGTGAALHTLAADRLAPRAPASADFDADCDINPRRLC